MNIGPMIRAGLVEAAWARIAITVEGMRLNEPKTRAIKVQVASEACSGSVFSVFSSAMVFKPMGVATFPNPKKLALTVSDIKPSTGWFLGIFGNSLANTGRNNFASVSVIPETSATLRIPDQKAIIPAKPIENSMALLALVNMEVEIMAVFPVAIEIKIPMPIKIIQMMLIMGSTSFGLLRLKKRRAPYQPQFSDKIIHFYERMEINISIIVA